MCISLDIDNYITVVSTGIVKLQHLTMNQDDRASVFQEERIEANKEKEHISRVLKEEEFLIGNLELDKITFHHQ